MSRGLLAAVQLVIELLTSSANLLMIRAMALKKVSEKILSGYFPSKQVIFTCLGNFSTDFLFFQMMLPVSNRQMISVTFNPSTIISVSMLSNVLGTRLWVFKSLVTGGPLWKPKTEVIFEVTEGNGAVNWKVRRALYGQVVRRRRWGGKRP